MVSRTQEFRIVDLRKKYIRYGKEKLKRICQEIYQEPVSSWKIQRVIEKRNLYYNPSKTEKLRKKRKRSQIKKRITELQKEQRAGFLVAFDGLTICWNGVKQYILTAIDVYSKIAFARMYPTGSSKNAADFLERIHYLLEGKIENITYDCDVFNRKLIEWLIEYNFRRPHQSLGHLPPINFHYKYHKVLPMYPSSTGN